jgi:hypothetical protein
MNLDSIFVLFLLPCIAIIVTAVWVILLILGKNKFLIDFKGLGLNVSIKRERYITDDEPE